MKNVRTIAIGGILTAIIVALLTIIQFIPSGRIAVAALCGVIIFIAIKNYGIRLGVLCYIASAVLALFIVADKTYPGLFAIVFGLYSIFKVFADKNNKITGFFLKTLFYVIEAIVLYFLYKAFAGKIPFNNVYMTLIFIAGYIVFIVYDVAIMQFYRRIMNYLPKLK